MGTCLGGMSRRTRRPGTGEPSSVRVNARERAAAARPLSAWTVVSYLASRRLLTFEEAALSPPRVALRAGRSTVFRVQGRTSRWIVKQALDERTRRDQRREASMYRYLASAGAGRDITARLVHEDRGRAVLVLKDLPLHRPFSEGSFPAMAPSAAWETLGRHLADLHRHAPPPLAVEPPWVLSLDRPDPSFLRFAGSGRQRLLARIQQIGIWRHGLEVLRSGWRPVALTHGDLRLENVLLRLSAGAPDLRIVDWESAGPGDPATDMGWVVGDLLGRAIDSTGEIASVTDATRCLWRGYAKETGCSALSAEDVIHWAAARLLLDAFERLEFSSCLDDVPTGWLEWAERALTHAGRFTGVLFGKPIS